MVLTQQVKSTRENLNPETLKQLQESLYDWQLYNFGDQDNELALLGIYEECGELCHAQLKSEQGIRGTKEEHEAKFLDSIGDIMVYTLNYMSGIGETVTLYHKLDHVQKTEDAKTLRGAVTSVYRLSGRIEHGSKNVVRCVQQMILGLTHLCALKGWDLEQVIRDVWSKDVGLRDWKKYPKTGRQETEAAAQ